MTEKNNTKISFLETVYKQATTLFDRKVTVDLSFPNSYLIFAAGQRLKFICKNKI